MRCCGRFGWLELLDWLVCGAWRGEELDCELILRR